MSEIGVIPFVKPQNDRINWVQGEVVKKNKNKGKPSRPGTTLYEWLPTGLALSDQVGVPLEHAAQHQNPTNWSKQLPVCRVRLTRLLPGGSFFSFCTCIYNIPDGASPHTMQPQPVGKFYVLTQNKTLHNATKLVCFTSMLICVLCSHL